MCINGFQLPLVMWCGLGLGDVLGLPEMSMETFSFAGAAKQHLSEEPFIRSLVKQLRLLFHMASENPFQLP